VNSDKYVAALWVDCTKYGNGFKVLSEAKLYHHKPTKSEALEEFGKKTEDYTADKLTHFKSVECLAASDDHARFGDPAHYLLTISTESQMDEILDEIAKNMRGKIK
jgi:hypothetical protein